MYAVGEDLARERLRTLRAEAENERLLAPLRALRRAARLQKRADRAQRRADRAHAHARPLATRELV
ncbi:MAG: hypothetical protein ACT4P1_13925 [Sporichthyaceae bacterium]